MSFADEEEFAAFIGRDHLMPTFTTEAVANAMQDFPLALLPTRSLEWLSVAARRALAISMRHIEDGPNRTSNAEIKAELERLSALTSATWRELFECDRAAESQVWDYAWKHWDGEGGTEIGQGQIIGEPTLHRRFKAAIREIEWLSRLLKDAAGKTASQNGPWRRAEERQIRIERAQYLAVIFEAAFGQPVTANNWPNGTEYEKSSFMDFYQRMVALAFGERVTPDLSGVTKEACRRHRVYPARFADGMIPGLNWGDSPSSNA